LKRNKDRVWTTLVNQSIIVSIFRHLTEAIYKAFSSGLIGGFFTSADKTEALRENSFLNKQYVRLSIAKIISDMKLAFSKAVETSGLFRYYRRFTHMLLSKSMRVYGIYFLSFGGYSIIVYYIKMYALNQQMVEFHDLVIGGFLTLAGILLMFSDKKAVDALKEGRLSSIFLYKLIGIREVSMYIENHLNKKAMGAFTLGMICGLITLFFSPAYILEAVIALILIALVIYTPESGILLSILLLPFLPTMILIGLNSLVTVSYIFKLLRGKRNLKLRLTDIAVIIFMLSLFLTGVISVGRESSIQYMLVMICFTCSYFLVVNLIKSKELIDCGIRSLVISGSIVAILGAGEYFLGLAPQKWLDIQMFQSIAGRVVSTFENPNVLGEYLILLLPIFIIFLTFTKKLSYKLGSLLLLAIMLICLYYTWSRGAWLCAVVSILLLIFLISKKTFTVSIWVALLIPIILTTISGSDFWLRISSIGNMLDSSTSYRVYIWEASTKMIGDYINSGIGIGGEAFSKVYLNYAYSGIEAAPHSHSLYLQLLIEGGIWQLVIFGASMLLILQTCFSKAANILDKKYKYMILAVVCGIIAFLGMGVVDYVWYNYRVFLFFWLMCGFGSAVALNAPTPESDTNKGYIS